MASSHTGKHTGKRVHISQDDARDERTFSVAFTIRAPRNAKPYFLEFRLLQICETITTIFQESTASCIPWGDPDLALHAQVLLWDPVEGTTRCGICDAFHVKPLQHTNSANSVVGAPCDKTVRRTKNRCMERRDFHVAGPTPCWMLREANWPGSGDSPEKLYPDAAPKAHAQGWLLVRLYIARPKQMSAHRISMYPVDVHALKGRIQQVVFASHAGFTTRSKSGCEGVSVVPDLDKLPGESPALDASHAHTQCVQHVHKKQRLEDRPNGTAYIFDQNKLHAWGPVGLDFYAVQADKHTAVCIPLNSLSPLPPISPSFSAITADEWEHTFQTLHIDPTQKKSRDGWRVVMYKFRELHVMQMNAALQKLVVGPEAPTIATTTRVCNSNEVDHAWTGKDEHAVELEFLALPGEKVRVAVTIEDDCRLVATSPDAELERLYAEARRRAGAPTLVPRMEAVLTKFMPPAPRGPGPWLPRYRKGRIIIDRVTEMYEVHRGADGRMRMIATNTVRYAFVLAPHFCSHYYLMLNGTNAPPVEVHLGSGGEVMLKQKSGLATHVPREAALQRVLKRVFTNVLDEWGGHTGSRGALMVRHKEQMRAAHEETKRQQDALRLKLKRG